MSVSSLGRQEIWKGFARKQNESEETLEEILWLMFASLWLSKNYYSALFSKYKEPFLNLDGILIQFKKQLKDWRDRMLNILWNEKLYLGFVNYFYLFELTGIHEVTQDIGEYKKAEVQKSHWFWLPNTVSFQGTF